MRNTYVTGLRAALAIAETREAACRAEEERHRRGEPNFTPEANAMWERMERQCALEAKCIAGQIRKLIDEARKTLREQEGER